MADMYRLLVGTTFCGKYLETKRLGSNTEWDVIEVTDMPSAMEETLQNIKEELEGRVWKGFTGPPKYPKYWLFAVVTTGTCTPQNEYRFTITHVQPFGSAEEWRLTAAYTDRCGFCIKLSVL